MAQPHRADRAPERAFVAQPARTRYLVVRQEDVWFIKFDGEDYGPYQSEREALLFAIDAAHKLGEQGEHTQVLVMDENGDVQPLWTYGHDPYPPRF
jgi:hypothetical protein